MATEPAQVERVGNRLQLSTQWIVDDYGGEPLTKEILSSRGRLPFQSQLEEACGVSGPPGSGDIAAFDDGTAGDGIAGWQR